MMNLIETEARAKRHQAGVEACVEVLCRDVEVLDVIGSLVSAVVEEAERVAEPEPEPGPLERWGWQYTDEQDATLAMVDAALETRSPMHLSAMNPKRAMLESQQYLACHRNDMAYHQHSGTTSNWGFSSSSNRVGPPPRTPQPPTGCRAADGPPTSSQSARVRSRPAGVKLGDPGYTYPRPMSVSSVRASLAALSHRGPTPPTTLSGRVRTPGADSCPWLRTPRIDPTTGQRRSLRDRPHTVGMPQRPRDVSRPAIKQKRPGTWDEFKIPEQEKEVMQQKELRKRAMATGKPPPMGSVSAADGLFVARDIERVGLAAIAPKTKGKAKQGKVAHDEEVAVSQKQVRKQEREDKFEASLHVLETRMVEAEEKTRKAGIRALDVAEQARMTQSAAHRKSLADANGKRQACEREVARARKARDDALAWREVQKELDKKKKQRLNQKRRASAKKHAKIGDDLDFIKRYQRKQDARLTQEWSTRQTVAHVLRVRGALEKRGIMDLPPVPMGMDLNNIDPLGDPRLREHKVELDLFVERRMNKEEAARDLAKKLEQQAMNEYLAEEKEKIENWKASGGAAAPAIGGAVPETPEKNGVNFEATVESRAASPARSSRSAAEGSERSAYSPEPGPPSVGAVVAMMHQAEHMATGGEKWFATERLKLREWTLAGISHAPRDSPAVLASRASVAASNGGLVRGRPVCVQAFGLRSTTMAHERLQTWRGDQVGEDRRPTYH